MCLLTGNEYNNERWVKSSHLFGDVYEGDTCFSRSRYVFIETILSINEYVDFYKFSNETSF